MTKDLVIGIDSSTSATKAIAWDAWRPYGVAEETHGHRPRQSAQPGYFEQQNADEWWRFNGGGFARCSAKVDPTRIAAVAVSNQRETFGPFTEDGAAMRPAMTWLDERARPQVGRFGKSFGAERVHAISGKPLDVLPCLYRIIWMAEHEPDILPPAPRGLPRIHGYLTYRADPAAGETSTASADPTGLLDMTSRTWSAEILGAIGIAAEKLPLLTRPGARMGEVTRTAAAFTGLAAGTPVIAGGGDGQCAGDRGGHPRRRAAPTSIWGPPVSGRELRARLCPSSRLPHRECRVRRRKHYIYPEMCIRTGTFLSRLDERARMLGTDPSKQQDATLSKLEAEAAKCPIGAGGVIVLPLLARLHDPLLGSLCARCHRHRITSGSTPVPARFIARCWRE